MKKLSVLSVLMVLILCSCSSTPEPQKMKIQEGVAFQAEPAEVVISAAENVDLSNVTEDPENEILAITNDSIVYSRDAESLDGTRPCEFYRYVIETEEHIKLGTIYNWSYGFKEHFVNNKLYVPRTCQLKPEEKASSWILELDLDTNSMSVVSQDEDHESIYTREMQGLGKYLLLHQTQKEFDRLIAYDTDTKELIELIKYEYAPDTETGKRIQAFDVGKDSIAILVKELTDSGEEKYYIDVYNDKIDLIDTVDVTTAANWRNGVLNFEYENGYLIFSNISNNGFIGEIEGDEVKPIVQFYDSSFFLFIEISECMQYKMWIDQETNEIYRLNMNDGLIEKTNLNPDVNQELFMTIVRYSDESMLIEKTSLTAKEIPEFQYVLMEELDFKIVE